VKALCKIRRMATKPSPAVGRGEDADSGRDLKALEQRRLKAVRLFATVPPAAGAQANAGLRMRRPLL
jgi:hypothetical protein